METEIIFGGGRRSGKSYSFVTSIMLHPDKSHICLSRTLEAAMHMCRLLDQQDIIYGICYKYKWYGVYNKVK